MTSLRSGEFVVVYPQSWRGYSSVPLHVVSPLFAGFGIQDEFLKPRSSGYDIPSISTIMPSLAGLCGNKLLKFLRMQEIIY